MGLWLNIGIETKLGLGLGWSVGPMIGMGLRLWMNNEHRSENKIVLATMFFNNKLEKSHMRGNIYIFFNIRYFNSFESKTCIDIIDTCVYPKAFLHPNGIAFSIFFFLAFLNAGYGGSFPSNCRIMVRWWT